MKVETIDSVDGFIAITTPFRAADPLRTNIIGSVSLAVSTGRATYDDYHWWVVRDDAGTVVGIAMHTSPFNLSVAPMPLAAARALGQSVGRSDDTFAGVSGSRDVVNALVEGYVDAGSPGSQRALVEGRLVLLYELEELVTPSVEGAGRPARDEEVDVLARMLVAFAEELDHLPVTFADARESAKRSVLAGTLFCWELDGAVVSIAGHAAIVTTESIVIGRVGPVYTPPAFRRRGYAGAVTAYVSRHLIEKGARVMLFTDAANPTSNSVYQKIGYRLVDELIDMQFVND